MDLNRICLLGIFLFISSVNSFPQVGQATSLVTPSSGKPVDNNSSEEPKEVNTYMQYNAARSNLRGGKENEVYQHLKYPAAMAKNLMVTMY